MKAFICVLLIGLILTSCNSCFYRVHENPTPLNMEFQLEPNSSGKFRSYIEALNSKAIDSCRPISIKVDDGDKILCLSECECYLVTIKEDKVLIPAVYVPSKTTNAWLTKREQMEDTAINRIKKRFEAEVLSTFKTEFAARAIIR